MRNWFAVLMVFALGLALAVPAGADHATEHAVQAAADDMASAETNDVAVAHAHAVRDCCDHTPADSQPDSASCDVHCVFAIVPETGAIEHHARALAPAPAISVTETTGRFLFRPPITA